MVNGLKAKFSSSQRMICSSRLGMFSRVDC